MPLKKIIQESLFRQCVHKVRDLMAGEEWNGCKNLREHEDLTVVKNMPLNLAEYTRSTRAFVTRSFSVSPKGEDYSQSVCIQIWVRGRVSPNP